MQLQSHKRICQRTIQVLCGQFALRLTNHSPNEHHHNQLKFGSNIISLSKIKRNYPFRTKIGATFCFCLWEWNSYSKLINPSTRRTIWKIVIPVSLAFFTQQIIPWSRGPIRTWKLMYINIIEIVLEFKVHSGILEIKCKRIKNSDHCAFVLHIKKHT